MKARALCIILAVLSIVAALEVPEVDFLLDHPAVSLSISHKHFCTIQQRHNDEEIGGEAVCFGHEDDSGRTEPPTDSTFVQVITGEHYGCGLLLDQTVRCWGAFKDVEVKGLFSQIVGTDDYGCGIMTDETIQCFGHLPRFRPTDSKIGFVQIACSKQHCCALDKLGVPTCWSEDDEKIKANYFLRPPKHTRELTESEKDAMEAEEEDGYDEENDLSGDNVQFKQISVSGQYSCGITFDDALQCWGHPKSFGIQSMLKHEGPFKTVSVGESGVCAIHSDTDADSEEEEEVNENGEIKVRSHKPNSIKCWGSGASRLLAAHAPELGDHDWDQVRVRKSSICGVTMQSEIKCMGTMHKIVIPDDLIVA